MAHFHVFFCLFDHGEIIFTPCLSSVGLSIDIGCIQMSLIFVIFSCDNEIAFFHDFCYSSPAIGFVDAITML